MQGYCRPAKADWKQKIMPGTGILALVRGFIRVVGSYDFVSPYIKFLSKPRHYISAAIAPTISVGAKFQLSFWSDVGVKNVFYLLVIEPMFDIPAVILAQHVAI